MSEVIIPLAQMSDLDVRANLVTEKVEITYLPTGTKASLTLEETDQLVNDMRQALTRLKK